MVINQVNRDSSVSRRALGPTPALYPMGTRDSFPGGIKWPRREADHSPPSNAEVKECV